MADKKSFKVGDDVYDIPVDEMAGFQEAFPDATEVQSFKDGDDIYDVPLDQVDSFVEAFPNAKSLYSVNGKEKESTFAGDLFTAFQRGSARIGQYLAETPGFIYDAFAIPQNIVAERLGIPVGTSSQQFAEKFNLPDNKIADFYENQVKELGKEIDEKYDEGITDLLGQGRIGDAIKATAMQVSESAPITIGLIMGNAAGIAPLTGTIGGGLVFGAGEAAELKDRKDIPESQKTINSLAKGFFEGAFEQIGLTRLGKIAFQQAKTGGMDAVREFAEKAFREVYGPLLQKYGIIGAEEILSEAGTQFAQNVVSKYGGEDPDLNLAEGVADAGIVGLGSSIAFSGPVAGAEILQTAIARANSFYIVDGQPVTREEMSNVIDSYSGEDINFEIINDSELQQKLNNKVNELGLPPDTGRGEGEGAPEVPQGQTPTDVEGATDEGVRETKPEQIVETPDVPADGTGDVEVNQDVPVEDTGRSIPKPTDEAADVAGEGRVEETEPTPIDYDNLTGENTDRLIDDFETVSNEFENAPFRNEQGEWDTTLRDNLREQRQKVLNELKKRADAGEDVFETPEYEVGDAVYVDGWESNIAKIRSRRNGKKVYELEGLGDEVYTEEDIDPVPKRNRITNSNLRREDVNHGLVVDFTNPKTGNVEEVRIDKVDFDSGEVSFVKNGKTLAEVMFPASVDVEGVVDEEVQFGKDDLPNPRKSKLPGYKNRRNDSIENERDPNAYPNIDALDDYIRKVAKKLGFTTYMQYEPNYRDDYKDGDPMELTGYFEKGNQFLEVKVSGFPKGGILTEKPRVVVTKSSQIKPGDSLTKNQVYEILKNNIDNTLNVNEQENVIQREEAEKPKGKSKTVREQVPGTETREEGVQVLEEGTGKTQDKEQQNQVKTNETKRGREGTTRPRDTQQVPEPAKKGQEQKEDQTQETQKGVREVSGVKNIKAELGKMSSSEAVGSFKKLLSGWGKIPKTFFKDTLTKLMDKGTIIPVKVDNRPGSSPESIISYSFHPELNDNVKYIRSKKKDYAHITPKNKEQEARITSHKLYDSEIIDENGNILDDNYEYLNSSEFSKDDTYDDQHLYRGLSEDELNSIRKKGYIQSEGSMNLGEQQRETTSFAQYPSQAVHYASNFAPEELQPSFKKRNYVVKVKKEGVDFTPTIKSSPKNEVDVKGKVPIENIVGVYEIRLGDYEVSGQGHRDIFVEQDGSIREGSGSPTQRTYLISKQPFTLSKGQPVRESAGQLKVINVGKNNTPVVKIGDKYFRAKKTDGSPTKQEIKNPELIKEFNNKSKTKEDAKTKSKRESDDKGRKRTESQKRDKTVQQDKSGEQTDRGRTRQDQGKNVDKDTTRGKQKEQIKDDDGGGKKPPPPPKGKDGGGKDSKGPSTRESKLGKRTVEGKGGITEGLRGKIKDIEVMSKANNITIEQADAIIEDVGIENAMRIIENPANNIPVDVRATIGMRIVKKLDDAAAKEKDETARDALYDVAADSFDSLMDLANKVGRALQMFKMWRDMGPEGYVRYAMRVGEKIKRNVSKKNEKYIDALVKANKDALRSVIARTSADFAKRLGVDRAKFIGVVKDTLNKDLAKRLEKEFGFEAKRAKKIAKSISSNIDKQYGKEFKRRAQRAVPARLRKFRGIIDKLINTTNLTEADIVNQIVNEMGIQTELTPEQIKDLRSKLGKLRNVPENSRQLKDDGVREALKLINETFGDEAQAYLPKSSRDSLGWGLFYASILSGQRTQALNVGANIVKMLMDNFLLSTSEFVANPQDLKLKDNFIRSFSNWAGIMEAMSVSVGVSKVGPLPIPVIKKKGMGSKEFAEILKEGRQKSERSNKFFDESELERWGKEWKTFNKINNAKDFWNAVKSNAAFLAKYVPRFMAATDAYFYWGNYYGKMRQLMSDLKRDEGLTGKELAKEVDKIMDGGTIGREAAEMQALDELKPVNEDTGRREFKDRVGGGKYNDIDVRRRTDEIIEDSLAELYGEEVLGDADRFAKNATFQQDPTGIMGSAARAISRAHASDSPIVSTASRFIVPFTRIVANVTNDQLSYIPPIGLLRGGDSKFSSSELTADERRIVYAKGVMGTAIMVAAAALALAWNPEDEDDDFIKIHGNGPKDFQKLMQLKANNWQPNSIQVGNTYISTKEFSFGLLLTLIGNVFDNIRYNGGTKMDLINPIPLTESLVSAPETILEASFLSGLASFAETTLNTKGLKGDKLVERWGKWAISQPRFLIPGLFRQVSGSFDPVWYQTQGLDEYMYKQYALPFVQPITATTGRATGLMPYYTALGDEVTFGRKGAWGNMARLSGISRFVNISKKDEPVYNFLNSKNLYINGLGYSTKVDGESLWQTDRDLFIELNNERGKIIKDYIRRNMDRYEDMSKSEIEADMAPLLDSRKKNSATRLAKEKLGITSKSGGKSGPKIKQRGRDYKKK